MCTADCIMMSDGTQTCTNLRLQPQHSQHFRYIHFQKDNRSLIDIWVHTISVEKKGSCLQYESGFCLAPIRAGRGRLAGKMPRFVNRWQLCSRFFSASSTPRFASFKYNTGAPKEHYDNLELVPGPLATRKRIKEQVADAFLLS